MSDAPKPPDITRPLYRQSLVLAVVFLLYSGSAVVLATHPATANVMLSRPIYYLWPVLAVMLAFFGAYFLRPRGALGGTLLLISFNLLVSWSCFALFPPSYLPQIAFALANIAACLIFAWPALPRFNTRLGRIRTFLHIALAGWIQGAALCLYFGMTQGDLFRMSVFYAVFAFFTQEVLRRNAIDILRHPEVERNWRTALLLTSSFPFDLVELLSELLFSSGPPIAAAKPGRARPKNPLSGSPDER